MASAQALNTMIRITNTMSMIMRQPTAMTAMFERSKDATARTGAGSPADCDLPGFDSPFSGRLHRRVCLFASAGRQRVSSRETGATYSEPAMT